MTMTLRPAAGLLPALLLFATPARAAVPRFTEHLVSAEFTYPYGVEAADLDGDGDVDLTASDGRGRNSMYWFENAGAGRFTRHLLHYQPAPAFLLERHVIADVNRDGRPDVIVVENSSGDLRWLENPGPAKVRGEWPVHFITRSGDVTGAYDVAFGDLDGDGLPDVAASSWRKGNMFSWHRHPGATVLTEPKWVQTPVAENLLETRMVRLADVDGDGDLDILGTAARAGLVLWLENPGRPTLLPWTQHCIDVAPRACHGQVVDLDRDGDPDLVLASGFGEGLVPSERHPVVHEVVWYENLGKGVAWKKHVIGRPFDQAFEAIPADLDGDGDDDVVATAWHDGTGTALVWYENAGGDVWTQHVLKENWPRACQVIAADLNGDGRLDLAAVAEGTTRELRWWRNEGP